VVKSRYQYVSLSLSAVLLIVVLSLCLLCNKLTRAQGASQVGAVLCDSQGPDIQVTSPESDTIVNTSPLEITGVLQRTSQLDIYVNEEYSNSLAISSDNTLSIHISLKPGTNTIKFKAYFSCNTTSAEKTIIVEYVPVLTNSATGDIAESSDDTVETLKSPAERSVLDSLQSEIKNEYGIGDPEGGKHTRVESFVKVTSNRTLLIVIVITSVLYWNPVIFGSSIYKKFGIRIATKKGRVRIRRYFKWILYIIIANTLFLLAI